MKTTTRREFLKTTAAAAVPSAAFATGTRPNFLFFFPDQLRFDWAGGDPRIVVRTPNLDALSQRGISFTRAVVASPLCAPARACLAAGKEYDRGGVPSNQHDYPLTQKTYYTLLRDSGYHVAGCGKFDLHKATMDWGLDGKRLLSEWGFSDGIDNAGKFDAIRSGAEAPKDPYMAYLHRRGLAATHVEDFRKRAKLGYQATFPTPLPEEAYCDNWVANNGLELMKRFPKGKPWHLVVNFTGPHNPMDVTRRMDKLCRGRAFPQPNGSRQYTPEIHVAIRQNYSAMVENIDRWLGIYIDELKRRGELDNTLIVFSSDHGEMLGDHDRWGKSVPYQPSVGVPLVIGGPGVRPGGKSDALVSVVDLTATFLDFAGITAPSDMDSRSLRPLLEGKTRSHRQYLVSGLDPWRMVFDGRYKLIRGFDPERRKRLSTEDRRSAENLPPLLFDLHQDPLENANIAARAPAEVARLSRLLG